MTFINSSFTFLLFRCMIRDVPVKVPEPDDFIAEYIFPSHIVVPRCSGNRIVSYKKACMKTLYIKIKLQKPLYILFAPIFLFLVS